MGRRTKRRILGLDVPRQRLELEHTPRRRGPVGQFLGKAIKTAAEAGIALTLKGAELGVRGAKAGGRILVEKIRQHRMTSKGQLRLVSRERPLIRKVQEKGGFTLEIRQDLELGQRLVEELGLAGVVSGNKVILGSRIDGKPKQLVESDDHPHQLEPLTEDDLEVLTPLLRAKVWNIGEEVGE